MTKCRVAGHNLMFNARQSENFTDFPMKGPLKLLRINRCLFRNVKRFQKLIFFSVDKVSELEYAIIYRSVIDTLLIWLPGTISNRLNASSWKFSRKCHWKVPWNRFLFGNVKRFQTLIFISHSPSQFLTFHVPLPTNTIPIPRSLNDKMIYALSADLFDCGRAWFYWGYNNLLCTTHNNV